MESTEEKYQRLQNILKEMRHVLVAFSGGTDSTFLLKVAADVLGNQVLAVTANSEIQPQHEFEEAKAFVQKLGVAHLVIRTNEMQDETFLQNPPDRCYHCKKSIFSAMKQIALEKGIPFIVDGTNADDIQDYRPGLRALNELNIRSPLRKAQLTKSEIRQLSKEMNLPTWDRPALACLASRIPYGTRITPEKLARIDKSESYLRDIGFTQIRVRDHDTIARIEVSRENKNLFLDNKFSDKIVQYIKDLGYQYVALDLEGYRTGSLNEILKANG